MKNFILEFLALLFHLFGIREPILLTTYDPAQGGINCVEPCGQTALGYWYTPDDYWNGLEGIAACPKEWLGAEIVIDGFGTVRCLDTGGRILRHQWNPYHRRFVTHVDVMVKEPLDQTWNYHLFENYRVVWP